MRLMSMRIDGRSKRKLRIGTRLCPPAMILASSPPSANAAAAISTLSPRYTRTAPASSVSHIRQPSSNATQRVHPAEAASILTGKQHTLKPDGGSLSRLVSFSMWQ